ncbi:MAG: hypothetical protein A2770_03015 [Candidatus Levybacteria bacterium RIFCSPHIGHO2_01_FULL_38_12]|nr:MAG: hypothetical protein A2770_03015 [Candidatus Levybacteria bacterium RIFCSPHIGHO2_01_FULL_38_12]
MKLKNLSLIIPLYNEEMLLKDNFVAYYEYLNNLTCIENFEIVLIDNACTDTTPLILKQLRRDYKNIQIYKTARKGLGLALKEGIDRATYDVVMFTAIDICFGLGIIEQSIEKYLEGYTLILGSKGHRKSVYKARLQRMIFSRFYNFLLRLLFNTNIRDTQGTFLINKKLNQKTLSAVDSEDAWFQTQLALYINKTNKNTVEIPVRYIEQGRKSRINYTDALKILRNMLKGYLKYRKWKPFNII